MIDDNNVNLLSPDSREITVCNSHTLKQLKLVREGLANHWTSGTGAGTVPTSILVTVLLSPRPVRLSSRTNFDDLCIFQKGENDSPTAGADRSKLCRRTNVLWPLDCAVQ